jgi:hypothetical protein
VNGDAAIFGLTNTQYLLSRSESEISDYLSNNYSPTGISLKVEFLGITGLN